MIAMLLAAQLSAALAADPSAIRVLSADGVPVSVELVASQLGRVPLTVRPPPATERMPNLYQVPPQCQNVPYHVVDQYGRPLPIRLGDLPNAGALQLLVDRKIDGCRVITVKQGVVARDQPNPPAESYRVRPLVKAPAEAGAPPAKREDAPSNRR
jgi:hypothetical protein